MTCSGCDERRRMLVDAMRNGDTKLFRASVAEIMKSTQAMMRHRRMRATDPINSSVQNKGEIK